MSEWVVIAVKEIPYSDKSKQPGFMATVEDGQGSLFNAYGKTREIAEKRAKAYASEGARFYNRVGDLNF